MNQKKRHIKPLLIFFAITAFSIGIAYAVHSFGNSQPVVQADGIEDAPAGITQDVTITDTGNVTSAYFTGLLPQKDLEDLVVESNLIIRAVPSSEEAPIRVQNTYGNIMNYTEYKLQVSETIQGEPLDTVTLRMPEYGADEDGMDVFWEDKLELNIGQEYIFFLYRPDYGGGCHTEGDYYYLTGSRQGLHPVNGASVCLAAPILDDTEGEIPVPDLIAEIETCRSNIPEGQVFSLREEILKSAQHNLETGFITQDEYDRMLREMDVYAVII